MYALARKGLTRRVISLDPYKCEYDVWRLVDRLLLSRRVQSCPRKGREALVWNHDVGNLIFR